MISCIQYIFLRGKYAQQWRGQRNAHTIRGSYRGDVHVHLIMTISIKKKISNTRVNKKPGITLTYLENSENWTQGIKITKVVHA